MEGAYIVKRSNDSFVDGKRHILVADDEFINRVFHNESPLFN